ncbi:PLAC8 family-domain-containing protein [Aspergillus venezuelensis]
MSDPTQKVYRSWPSGPPTYQQANTDQFKDVTQNTDYNYGLGDCCSPGSLCFTSCCLPCLTFGKTQARLRDPALKDFNYCNFDCTLFTLLGMIGSQWIIQTIRRGEMRDRYGIKGSCCGDCCATFWCGCCAIIQDEKETELRSRPELVGYQPTPQMGYQ